MRHINQEYARIILNDTLINDVTGKAVIFVNASIVASDKVGVENKGCIGINKGYLNLGPMYWGGRDFTLEFWMKTYTYGSYQASFAFSPNREWAGQVFLEHRYVDKGSFRPHLNLHAMGLGTNWLSYGNDSNWHHYALTCSQSSRTIRFFRDGVRILNRTFSSFSRFYAGAVYIGATLWSGDEKINARFNNILLADGLCLYYNNFTPSREKIIIDSKILYVNRSENVYGALKLT